MAQRSRGVGVAALSLSLLLFTPAAAAMTPAELIDDELQQTPIRLTRLADGRVHYFDAQRQLQSQPLGRFVQLVLQTDSVGAESAADWPRVVLTDGQRWPGTLHGSLRGGQQVQWQHKRLGQWSVPLDHLLSLSLTAAAPPADINGQDTVLLSNQDRLLGFVMAITPEAIELLPAGSDASLRLPLERVAAITFANLPEPPAEGQQTIRLRDGTVLFGQSLDLDSHTLQFDAALPGQSMRSVSLPLEVVARLDFTAQGYRLKPLLEQAFEVVRGGSVFGHPMPPRAEGRDLHLHAPVMVRFDLPRGATRLQLVAELDLREVPRDVHDWADCELVIYTSDDDPSPRRYRLSADQPRHDINLPIEGSSLRLEIDPATNGPILDRVRLLHPHLLLHTPPASDAY